MGLSDCAQMREKRELECESLELQCLSPVTESINYFCTILFTSCALMYNRLILSRELESLETIKYLGITITYRNNYEK